MNPDQQPNNPTNRSLTRAPSHRRLWIMYHVMFVLLLAHFIMVYLFPGHFHDSRGQIRGLPTVAGSATRDASHVIERDDGTRLLHGGEEESMHFNITTFRLDPGNLNYGIGREAFPALIEPKFVSAAEASEWLGSDDRVLAVRIKGEVRVYPVELLIRHEVVNDVVAGVPIFAAYCILADLGAVYDRRLGDHTLTFALSGYTYADPDVWDGRDAFVLWDRETESLWWPPIGKAVSGALVDQPLKLLDEAQWSQTSWGEIAEKHPHATVLQRGQDFERPQQWTRIEQPVPESVAESSEPPTIAPRWGQNTLR